MCIIFLNFLKPVKKFLSKKSYMDVFIYCFSNIIVTNPSLNDNS